MERARMKCVPICSRNDERDRQNREYEGEYDQGPGSSCFGRITWIGLGCSQTCKEPQEQRRQRENAFDTNKGGNVEARKCRDCAYRRRVSRKARHAQYSAHHRIRKKQIFRDEAKGHKDGWREDKTHQCYRGGEFGWENQA